MPFYRIKGMSVHLRGTKMPKPCAAKTGFSAIHAEDSYCMDMSAYLCDGAGEKPGQTCDKALCAAHATEIGKKKHLCPDCRHAQTTPGHGSLFTSLVQS